MAKISTVTFNGSNAFELLSGEFITTWPHGATGFEQVSVGVQLYTATAGAGVRLTIRSFNISGGLISEQHQTHTISDTSMWERAEKTFSVPEGTDKVELRLTALVGTILLAQPKLANGTVVGSYATNFAPQLTKINPDGTYTGTLTAEQVIVGGSTLDGALLTLNRDLLSLTRGLDTADARITQVAAGAVQLGTRYRGVRLDQALGLNINSILNNRAVEIRLNTDEGLAYYADGLFRGGLRFVDSEVSLVSNIMSSDPTLKKYAKIGPSPFGYGITVFDKAIQTDPVISVQSGLDGGAMLLDEKQVARFHAYPNGYTILRGLAGVEQATFRDNGDYEFKALGKIKYRYSQDYGFHNFLDKNEYVRLDISERDAAGFVYRDGRNRERMRVAEDGAFSLRDATKERIFVPATGGSLLFFEDGGVVYFDRSGRERFNILQNGEFRYYDQSNRLRLASNDLATYMRAPNGNVSGADNGGVYKIIGQVKTYL